MGWTNILYEVWDLSVHLMTVHINMLVNVLLQPCMSFPCSGMYNGMVWGQFNTSWYTTFLVNVFSDPGNNCPCWAPSSTWTLTSHARRTLENATYSCPCVKTGSGRYIPTLSKVWPCDLLIVMAKARLRGNCRHWTPYWLLPVENSLAHNIGRWRPFSLHNVQE